MIEVLSAAIRGYDPAVDERVRARVASLVVTPNPRDDTPDNAELLRLILLWAVDNVERLYGECASPFHPRPMFRNQPRSQIFRLLDDSATAAVVIGSSARSWEDVFYDVCHESVHLLNPVFDVKNKSVSCLEEGCAVKFAESMYDTHVRPICAKRPPTSPVDSHPNPYVDAFSAARKIPDDVLKEVRDTFGQFSTIDDRDRFRRLVDRHVDEREIYMLLAPFAYG